MDLIFVVDLILNFRTAYMTPSGVLEERPRKIAQHYVKGWFLVDLLSCIPFRYLTGSGDQTSKAPKALRLVRLAKMLRLARLKRIVGQHLGSRFGLVSELSGFVAIFLIITCVSPKYTPDEDLIQFSKKLGRMQYGQQCSNIHTNSVVRHMDAQVRCTSTRLLLVLRRDGQ